MRLFCMICLLFLAHSSNAQHICFKKFIPNEMEAFRFYIIDFDGNEKFTIPKNTFPGLSDLLVKRYECEQQSFSYALKERKILHEESFVITEPNQKVLPLYSKDSTWLVDFEGQLIKSFGKKYVALSQPKKGILFGIKRISGGAYRYVYLNEKGEELFNGKEFAEANYFSEGRAIVKEASPENSWKIIDQKGNEIINRPNYITNALYNATEFANGKAIIEIYTRKEDQNNENSIASGIYLIDTNNKLQKLGQSGDIESFFYFLRNYEGDDFSIAMNNAQKVEASKVIDFMFVEDGMSLIVEGEDGTNQLIDENGFKIPFPNRYTPIKCIENLILGKRGPTYVLCPTNSTSCTFFKDESPTQIYNMLTDAEGKHVEEFIIRHNKIIKMDHFGIASLLDLEGKMIYNFEASAVEDMVPDEFKSLNELYECPDSIDFQQIHKNQVPYLNIKCETIDFKVVAKNKGMKRLIVTELKSIKNPTYLKEILSSNTTVLLMGQFDEKQLLSELDSVNSGELIINDTKVNFNK